MNAKSKRSDAERASVWYAVKNHNCIITRRALRTKFQKVDFFASDVVGKKIDGSHVYIQTTAGQSQAVTARRRKLEAVPWHYTDTVELLQLDQEQNPKNKRSKNWFFIVHVFNHIDRLWENNKHRVDIPKEWFTKYKED